MRAGQSHTGRAVNIIIIIIIYFLNYGIIYVNDRRSLDGDVMTSRQQQVESNELHEPPEHIVVLL